MLEENGQRNYSSVINNELHFIQKHTYIFQKSNDFQFVDTHLNKRKIKHLFLCFHFSSQYYYKAL